MELRAEAASSPVRLELPALLRAHEGRYRAAIAVTLPAAVLALVVGSVQPLPPNLLGSAATGAIGALVVLLVAVRGDRRTLSVVGGGAGLVGLVGLAAAGTLDLPIWVTFGSGAFLGAMAALTVLLARAKADDERAPLGALLTVAVVFVAFFMAAVGWTLQSARFLPRVLDPMAYVFDASLGVHSFDVGRVFARAPWLGAVGNVVYEGQPAVILLVYVRQLFALRPRADVLLATIVATLAAVAVFYVYPVIGPVFAFEKEFPSAPPPSEAMFLRPVVGLPEFRNCVPSMHNGWAILAVWHARPYGPAVRAIAWAALVATAATTLGLGYHYVFDIVVAVPFVLAAHALTLEVEVDDRSKRRTAIAVGVTLVVALLLLDRYGTRAFQLVPGLAWVLAIGSTTACLVLEHRVSARAVVNESPLERLPGLGAGVATMAAALGAGAGSFGVAETRMTELAFGTEGSLWRLAVPPMVALVPVLIASVSVVSLVDVAAARGATRTRALALATAWAAFGAGVSVFFAPYSLLPWLGFRAAAATGGLVVVGIMLASHAQARKARHALGPVARPVTPSRAPLVALLAGVLVASAAVTVSRLLALEVGVGAFAERAEVAAVFVALAVGAVIAPRVTLARRAPAWGIALVALTVSAFEARRVPGYLASFRTYPYGQTFAEQQEIRFGVALVVALGALAGIGAVAVGTLLRAQGKERPTAFGLAAGVILGGTAASLALSSGPGDRALVAFAGEGRGEFVWPGSDDVEPARVDRFAETASAAAPGAKRVLLCGPGASEVAPMLATRGATDITFVHSDPRAALVAAQVPFGLVAVDAPSVWRGGDASLFTRGFDDAVGARLSPAGVLVVRFPFERLSLVDVVSILATARAVFPEVAADFDATSRSALLVACATACPSLPPRLRTSDVQLTSAAVDALLASAGADGADLILADDDPALEYEAPREATGDPRKAAAVVLKALEKFGEAAVR